MAIPGLPNLPAANLVNFVEPTLLAIADGTFFGVTAPPPIWGIFNAGGANVLTADTVVGFDFRVEARVSDYPQEQGAFASYNKVQTPYGVRLTFAIGQTEAQRAAFLAQLDSLYQEVETLYSAVTPEITYLNATIVRYEYRRTQRDGANMLIADVYLEQVRQASDTGYTAAGSFPASQVFSFGGASPLSLGQVQALAPSVPQLGAISLPTVNLNRLSSTSIAQLL